jgi:hypothetical protein
VWTTSTLALLNNVAVSGVISILAPWGLPIVINISESSETFSDSNSISIVFPEVKSKLANGSRLIVAYSLSPTVLKLFLYQPELVLQPILVNVVSTLFTLSTQVFLSLLSLVLP